MASLSWDLSAAVKKTRSNNHGKKTPVKKKQVVVFFSRKILNPKGIYNVDGVRSGLNTSARGLTGKGVFDAWSDGHRRQQQFVYSRRVGACHST